MQFGFRCRLNSAATEKFQLAVAAGFVGQMLRAGGNASKRKR